LMELSAISLSLGCISATGIDNHSPPNIPIATSAITENASKGE
jgi:hypothetical protein